MSIEFEFYSNKVYKSGSVRKYRMVIKFIVKTVEFEKVIIVVKKPIRYIWESLLD